MRANEILKPKLFLDMDGVQADFFTAWARWHNRRFGASHVLRYKDIGSRDQREQSIEELNNEGPEFVTEYFATLPPLPGGQKLLRWLRDNHVPFTVLSAPLRGQELASIAGKRAWLTRYNPGAENNAIFTGEKARFATQGGHSNILVDDFKKYINEWESAGGTGILYRDANVNRIIEQLAHIYNIG